MLFHFSIYFLIVALVWTVKAVPELEHDNTEIDMHDCHYYSKLTCLRECPKGFVAVYRSLCSAAEDQHECCAVWCCRSRHNGEQEDDENDETNGSDSHSYGDRYTGYSRSPFHKE